MFVFPPCCFGGVPILVYFVAGGRVRFTTRSDGSVPVVVVFFSVSWNHFCVVICFFLVVRKSILLWIAFAHGLLVRYKVF